MMEFQTSAKNQTIEAAVCIFNAAVYFVFLKSQEEQMTSTHMQMCTN